MECLPADPRPWYLRTVELLRKTNTILLVIFSFEIVFLMLSALSGTMVLFYTFVPLIHLGTIATILVTLIMFIVKALAVRKPVKIPAEIVPHGDSIGVRCRSGRIEVGYVVEERKTINRPKTKYSRWIEFVGWPVNVPRDGITVKRAENKIPMLRKKPVEVEGREVRVYLNSRNLLAIHVGGVTAAVLPDGSVRCFRGRELPVTMDALIHGEPTAFEIQEAVMSVLNTIFLVVAIYGIMMFSPQIAEVLTTALHQS